MARVPRPGAPGRGPWDGACAGTAAEGGREAAAAAAACVAQWDCGSDAGEWTIAGVPPAMGDAVWECGDGDCACRDVRWNDDPFPASWGDGGWPPAEW